MSAHICSDAHISMIVNFAHEMGLLNGRSPESVGQMLLDENYASVNHRYDESMKPERFVLHSMRSDDRLQVYKACRCYAYQSCEHPGWLGSEARQLNEMVSDLIARIELGVDGSVLARHHEKLKKHPRYNALEWSID